MKQDGAIDIFDPELLVEEPRSEVLFGINDGDSNATTKELRRAYTTITVGADSWNAIVHNASRRSLQFVPVDHNVEMDALCDGILYECVANAQLVFIELNEGRKDWIQQGVEQLRRTINASKGSIRSIGFARCEAYLCNSRHPHFAYSHKEVMQRFRNETSVRLYIQQVIAVV